MNASCKATYWSIQKKGYDETLVDFNDEYLSSSNDEAVRLRESYYLRQKNEIEFEFPNGGNNFCGHNLEAFSLNEFNEDDDIFEEEFMQNLIYVDLPPFYSSVFHYTQLLNVSRAERILGLLKFDHLGNDKRKEIESVIFEFTDRFHLKGEKLATTDVIEHSIPTINDVPVSAKPYRFPTR